MPATRKLNCVLLIDDDSATNFLHTLLLKKGNFAETIIVKENGKEALNYLLSPDNEDCETPDAIFLDLNMPLMNGWEFLDAYRDVYKDKKSKVALFILSNSDNPDDIFKASQFSEVIEYKNKPLGKNAISELYAKYFS